jgi:ataxia telangiectasia mutated family protein
MSDSSDMGYSIGWRTGTWDLPDPQDDARMNASLYCGLRVIHRERNGNVIDAVLSKSIRAELSRLKTLGNENMVQIRETTQTLMCIRELRRWRHLDIQNRIIARQTEQNAWKEFTSISSDFE